MLGLILGPGMNLGFRCIKVRKLHCQGSGFEPSNSPVLSSVLGSLGSLELVPDDFPLNTRLHSVAVPTRRAKISLNSLRLLFKYAGNAKIETELLHEITFG